MKVLVLNGSPRPNGAVSKILKEATNYLKNNNEVEWIDVYKLNIKPCIGCRGCRKNETECVQREDDAHIVGRKMKEAQSLIIGSPTHFNNMSSPLKALLDRNGTTLFVEPSFMPKPNHKGKPAIIVTACMSPSYLSFIFGMTHGVVKSIKVYLKYGGFKTVGTLIKTNTEKSTVLQLPIMKKIEKLCNRLEKLAVVA